MSMEMKKALDLLREIRPSIPKEVLELWCKDRDAFLESHPAVEQADASSCQGTNCGTTTGDHSSECLAEAAAGQGWELKPGDLCGRDCPIHKILAEQAGGDERKLSDLGNELHNLSCSIVHENEKLAEQIGGIARELWNWPQARAALAQPSPKCVKCGGTGEADSGGVHPWGEPVLIPCDCETEQAEAERPEVVARVVHSNPVVLGQCGPLNANDELMTVAQHAASVARWAEMFNRVEQQRDAALARVAELEMLLRKLSTNGLMQFSTVDEEMAVQAALGGAPVAQAGQVPDILTEDDMKWLRRFAECCEDSDAGGHDLPKAAVKQLVQIGALRHSGPGRQETTAFGDWLLDTTPVQGGFTNE
ncbi:TPA: hypothetical protein ACWMI6_005990 [Pseudomonas aeruginosa]